MSAARQEEGLVHQLPTHYEVLGISRQMLDDAQSSPADLLKRAYHRALLRYHPDKASTTSSRTGQRPPVIFTVDQISAAFAILSEPRKRAAYDRAVRDVGSQGDRGATAATAAAAQLFRTGVSESADLDDLAFDSVAQQWYRACRCGNLRGYRFGEADLEEAAASSCTSAGSGGGGGGDGRRARDEQLLVGCADCSLWLRVHFAVIDDDCDDGGGAETNEQSAIG